MIIPAFLLKQKVSIEPFMGATGRGEQFGEAFVEKGRFEQEQKLMRDATGASILCAAVLFVRPNTRIKVQDRVTYGGIQYTVKFVSPRLALSAPSHVEVRLQ
jgi:hypothetical protein